MSESTTDPVYFEFAYEPSKGGCSVSYLSDRQFAWPMSTGESLAARWPTDMTVAMRADRPKDVALTDHIHNLESALLASPRLSAFLREQHLPGLECLPVTVLDHKGRVASDGYAVIHSCRVVDCVDQERSEFKWDGLEHPSMIVSRMAINGAALDSDARLIRPQFVPGKLLVRADLMEALNQQKFSGLAFTRKLFGDSKVYRKPR